MRQWPFEWLAVLLYWLLVLLRQALWGRWPQQQTQWLLAVWQRQSQGLFALARCWQLGV